MRNHLLRWIRPSSPKAARDKTDLIIEIEALTIRLRQTEEQIRALYDALSALEDSTDLILPPRRLWP